MKKKKLLKKIKKLEKKLKERNEHIHDLENAITDRNETFLIRIRAKVSFQRKIDAMMWSGGPFSFKDRELKTKKADGLSIFLEESNYNKKNEDKDM